MCICAVRYIYTCFISEELGGKCQCSLLCCIIYLSFRDSLASPARPRISPVSYSAGVKGLYVATEALYLISDSLILGPHALATKFLILSLSHLFSLVCMF